MDDNSSLNVALSVSHLTTIMAKNDVNKIIPNHPICIRIRVIICHGKLNDAKSVDVSHVTQRAETAVNHISMNFSP